MIMVEVDGNYIDAEPMKNKTSKEQIRAYKELLTRIKSSGVCDPKLHILDNEASKDFQKEIEKQCKLQMVPPDTHRRNIAERAIQSFKNHFISILSGVDPSFPIFLWTKLLPQAIVTLNLLRPANVAPNVSAYAYVHGNFDFNATPLAPLGYSVLMYIKPHRRKSWGRHTSDGWYLGASLKHYRCHKVWNKKQRQKESVTLYFSNTNT